MKELTLKQWNDKGYKLKKNAKGVLDWNNCYYRYKVMRYSENEVKQMTDEEFKIYKKQKNHEAYLRAKENKIKKARIEYIYDNYKTSYQWLNLGYIILENQKPKIGSDLMRCYGINKASDYYYYFVDQVEYDPTKAKDILDNHQCPINYDGFKYW